MPYKKMRTHPLPDGLLPDEGEWQVDGVHGHPVELVLPRGPVVPDERVAHSARIEVVAEPTG